MNNRSGKYQTLHTVRLIYVKLTLRGWILSSVVSRLSCIFYLLVPVQSWDHHVKDGYKRHKNGFHDYTKPTWDGSKTSSVADNLEKNSSVHGYGSSGKIMIVLLIYMLSKFWKYYTPAPRRGRGGIYCFTSVRPSFHPSKIFFVAFFSATIDGRNLIFGHKLHIGMPYCG